MVQGEWRIVAEFAQNSGVEGENASTLTPESLLAGYGACRILTLAPQAAPAVRLWQGAPRAGLPPRF